MRRRSIEEKRPRARRRSSVLNTRDAPLKCPALLLAKHSRRFDGYAGLDVKGQKPRIEQNMNYVNSFSFRGDIPEPASSPNACTMARLAPADNRLPKPARNADWCRGRHSDLRSKPRRTDRRDR